MKQCPRCNRNYADDALSYCLDDGAVLVQKFDRDATLINPYPPSPPIVPPTVAYQRPPAVAPIGPPAYMPAPVRRRSPWVVGLLVLMALGVGLAIGGFIFQRSNSSSASSPSVNPAQEPVATHSTSPTPGPSPESSEKSRETTPATTNDGESTTVQDQQCVLYNDKSDKSVIRVRVNCDTQNCDSDVSTIAGEYPDNTPIRIVNGVRVQGSRFTWIKVVLVSSGQAVWVASTKIKCT